MKVFLILCVIIIIIFLLWYHKHKKFIFIQTENLITGAPKTGKSTLAIYLTIKRYKTNLWAWRFDYLKAKILKRDLPKRPCIYSNIPLMLEKCNKKKKKYIYQPLTKDLLTRKVKFIDRSCVYIGEFSLVADSMSIKDALINEELLLFVKLFGHELRGNLFIDTQAISDCHYSIKRCLSSYLWITKCFKIPFFIGVKCRELMYSYDNNMVNVNNDDIDNADKFFLIPKSIWKKFDFRCYSVLTDNLEQPFHEIVVDNLKCDNIVSFKKYKSFEVNNNGAFISSCNSSVSCDVSQDNEKKIIEGGEINE